MTPEQSGASVSAVILAVLPSVVGMVQALFAQQQPGAPVPTDAEVLALFASACTRSLAVDAAWLANHPGGTA